jgi:AcrR family transcriptional regulator
MDVTEDQTRPLRADAERNRRRILDAASELFAAKGLGVGLDEIAKHAGVGVGTAYRRFPDKSDLVAALFEERVKEVVGYAREALDDFDDPWEGLVHFMTRTVDLHARNAALKELIFAPEHAPARIGAAREQIRPLVEEIVARAKASGDLRSDAESTDLPMFQFLLTSPPAPHLAQRYLTIVLDGLRTKSPTALPLRALSPEELEAAMRGERP